MLATEPTGLNHLSIELMAPASKDLSKDSGTPVKGIITWNRVTHADGPQHPRTCPKTLDPL